MDEAGDLKVHVNGHHTLLLHQSVVCAFSGRLRAMVAQEKKRIKTASRGAGGGAEASMAIELAGFPGGAEGLELVVRFCYDSGRLPPLRPTELPLVHCAASFLDMTEEVRAGNLLVQAEAFVDDGLCHWTWADLLAAVKSCDSPFSSGLLDKLLSALFSRIAVGAETLTRSSSSTCSSSSPDRAGGRPSSAARTPESMKPSCLVGGREWWFDDVASLSPATVEKAMRVIGCYGAENKNLTLTRFLLHYLRRAATLRKVDDQGCLSGLADTAVHGVELGGGAAAFSCRGLFWALRVASAAGMSRECRRKLERLVGKILDQATLDDILVSGDGGGVYDVSLVIRLVRVFVSSVKEEKEATSPSPLSSSSRERMRKVGRLVDKYLAEISPDHGLGVSRFLAVAQSLPDSARDCYDGVYRALDIYLESHAALTVEERGTLCRCLNYGKLTLEACKDLAKNRRIPAGIAVQALSSQRVPKLPNPLSPSQTPRRVVVDEEKEALRVDLHKMQGRVVELETACKEMMGHVKVSRTAAKSFGGRGLPWMC
ncbi:BTB/POZ domain-containing protein At1g50280 [Lolium perenne]|uniref:BTB/POZ domain-containing protein At1g50280 n=1 Tax=Lolium perenne TaxID=4522 RepID=UPI0021EA6EF7|nr:BTB/POZ domain-containing protein At1g50280-like [Lolium perenne]